MQQFCTYGSGRGALGQPASLPRQNLERILGRGNILAKQRYGRMTGV
jgi:hypothetical protein